MRPTERAPRVGAVDPRLAGRARAGPGVPVHAAGLRHLRAALGAAAVPGRRPGDVLNATGSGPRRAGRGQALGLTLWADSDAIKADPVTAIKYRPPASTRPRSARWRGPNGG